MPIDVTIDNGETVFQPGNTVRATVTWLMERVPKRITACLFWTTAGKGTTDTVAPANVEYDAPQAEGEWAIELTIPPDAPPSYDGRLLSLRWGLEVSADKETREVALVVSPTGTAIIPQRLEK